MGGWRLALREGVSGIYSLYVYLYICCIIINFVDKGLFFIIPVCIRLDISTVKPIFI